MPRLGSFHLQHGLILAPILEVTTSPFRRLCMKYGAEMSFVPMVWTDFIVSATAHFSESVRISQEERPLGFQLITTNPEHLPVAFDVLESFSFDLYDLNVGCPSKNVRKRGAGGEMLGNLPLLEEILSGLAKYSPKPFSIKIRLGLTDDSALFPVLQLATKFGVDFVTIHARNVAQGYGGKADWDAIRRAKEIYPDLPIVGNGDVRTPQDARELIAQTSCEAVMVGRAAMNFPRIFSLFQAAFEGRDPPEIQPCVAFSDFLEFLDETLATGDPDICKPSALRGFLLRFCYGIPLARQYRRDIGNLHTIEEIREFAVEKWGST
ncbi:MAG TPA: tRNA-dihydrouridine synthase family protein [Candidatus Lokiarchaeia archaeon]|nr:tRNA-dihydrouridine synthase family protein [Candidatus Lokiarchaeia archaeon]